MTELYPITSDVLLPTPLSDGDQAIVNAIEQVEPGKRYDGSTTYISRAVDYRSAGTLVESVVAFTQEVPDQEETAYVYLSPFGILVAIDSRELGVTAYSERLVAFLDSPGAEEIKLKAARRIRFANTAVSSPDASSNH